MELHSFSYSNELTEISFLIFLLFSYKVSMNKNITNNIASIMLSSDIIYLLTWLKFSR